jgi:hypothetical protein
VAFFVCAGHGAQRQGSINVYADGTFVMNIPNTVNGQFYGFRSDDGPFNSVFLYDGGNFSGGAYQETYYAIDLALAPAPVPIPATVYLLGAGLAGLVGLRVRFRRSN